jgi:hypothetical protein
VRALAYLDANSGSLIVSAIAAGGAGVAVAAKMGMQRLRKPFSRRTSEDETAETEPVAEDA